MATTTRILDANVNGTVYTSNANSALEALDTCHSGALAPTDEVANGKLWLDTSTTPGILKIYNNATWEVVVNTTNVTASGALMDSELTDISSVKALDQGVATTDSPTFADVTATSLVVNGNNYPSAGALSNRNLIINGAMQVDQRGTSFAGLTNGGSKYTLDRWEFVEDGSVTGVFTITKDTDAPDGFASSLKYDCTTAQASLGINDVFNLQYQIEAQDLQRLNYGSGAAVETTISFWVKSNKTGDYAAWVYQPSVNRNYQVPYSIDVADAWEKKTGVIPADTTGVIANDNGTGFMFRFGLAAGTNYTSGTAPTAWETAVTANRFAGLTVNLADTIGNYLQITGVQLEVGDQSTPFEHRSYGQELTLCQRYYVKSNSLSLFSARALSSPNNSAGLTTRFPTTMRAAPTVAELGSASLTSLAVSGQTIDGCYWTASSSSAVSTANITGYTADAEL